MTLYDVLDKNLVRVPLGAINKEEAIEELASLISKKKGIPVKAITDKIWEREKLGSTAIGDGIAIPHCKSDKIETCEVAIGVCKEPIDFDGHEVKMIFMVIASPTRPAMHVQILSSIAKLCNSSACRNLLFEAPDKKSLISVLSD